ncbi:hypothetical protein GXW78_20955 [Roseomonas terrae]|uniref:YcxB-like protein domain-containing protein n=1 Tax=Neoroseomonas terrae TaxID=424799 RepID=A0ABS5EM84_9PROT|nr:YcxB family protein [Neoroseomonas terrae]MBR0652138.1 hypothetical protein [Neoroseomonas terrae]
MPSFSGTITRAQLEAGIGQAFPQASRRMAWRHGLPILLVWSLVIWPLAGFALAWPGRTIAAIGGVGLIAIAALWFWGWRRMRGEVEVLRRDGEQRGWPADLPVPVTLSMHPDTVELRFGEDGEPRPWSTLTRIDETRDFILVHFGTLPPFIMAKAGFAPADVAAIRAAFDARLAATGS